MTFKILNKLKQAEKQWEVRRKQAQTEKIKLQKIKAVQDKKMQKLYNEEVKHLKKEKEATDEIERIKQLKEQARKDVYGLTPEEKAQKQKEFREKTDKVLGFVARVLIPPKVKPHKMTKEEKREKREDDKIRREEDRAWGGIK